jgi:hypothetical protein
VIKPMTRMLALAVVFGFAAGTSPSAQEKAPAPVTPLKVQVVVSRSQGEKKISSLPYTLSINAGAAPTTANLRMGTKIPLMMIAGQPKEADGKALPQIGPVQYQDVGTNIDCIASTLDDGRFRVQITVDDSSVYPEETEKSGASSGHPSFRSFRLSNGLILKDGQTGQLAAATDKLTGETVRVDVTLTVIK